MQLLLIIAVLLLGGNDQNFLNSVKPALEKMGGEDVKSALNAAEELSGVINTLKQFQSLQPNESKEQAEQQNKNFSNANNCDGYPLDPIAKIADKNITYSLSKYLAENA